MYLTKFVSRSTQFAKMANVVVSSNFDGGNINVVKVDAVGECDVHAELKMRSEPYTEGTDKRTHSQWFYFKAANIANKNCVFNITNAGESSFPPAWPGTYAVASYDNATWFRTKTTYVDGCLAVHVAASDKAIVWVSYFAPYSYDQHQALIGRCQSARDVQGSPLCHVEVIGSSLQGRDIEMIRIGNGERKCWFIARQHPGESMAEWWADGFLNRLLDPLDDMAKAIRKLCTIHVVPNMNPDGAILGHLRTNATGANLNREWANTGDYEAPTLQRSPEVFHVLKKLDEIGCDFFVDVHGDEELPHIFFAPEVGAPNWNDRKAELYRCLCESQLRAFPAFQVEHGYGTDKLGEANLAICGAQITQRFDCLAVTLEMPYKDTFKQQDAVYGWSAPRCQKLGASMLDTMYPLIPLLRADFPFGNGGIGDGLVPPAWVLPGYENPPSQPIWDTTTK
eukprot:m.75240 g.75240  ORF g.75240 m.75240 type:complete len:452 (-) comp24758_c0_seq1:336-1691(-)